MGFSPTAVTTHRAHAVRHRAHLDLRPGNVPRVRVRHRANALRPGRGPWERLGVARGRHERVQRRVQRGDHQGHRATTRARAARSRGFAAVDAEPRFPPRPSEKGSTRFAFVVITARGARWGAAVPREARRARSARRAGEEGASVVARTARTTRTRTCRVVRARVRVADRRTMPGDDASPEPDGLVGGLDEERAGKWVSKSARAAMARAFRDALHSGTASNETRRTPCPRVV